MADTWTYDGAGGITDGFTPETTTDKYAVIVDYDPTEYPAGGIAYPGGGPQTINVVGTSGQPSGELFNARRFDLDTQLVKSMMMAKKGTSGLVTPPTLALPITWDGGAIVTAQLTTPSSAYDFALEADDPNSSITWLQGTSGSASAWDTVVLAETGLIQFIFVDETGSPLVDQSSGGNNGTAGGTNALSYQQASLLSTLSGHSVHFDGTNWVLNPAMGTATTFTVEAWTNVAGFDTDGNAAVYAGLSNLRCMVRGDGGYYFGVWISGTEYVLQGRNNINTYGLPDPRGNAVLWHFERNGTVLNVYQNNQLVDTLTGIPAGANTLTGSWGAASTAPQHRMTGNIQKGAIYNVALGQTKITNHWNARTGGGGGGGGNLSLSINDVGGIPAGDVLVARVLQRVHGSAATNGAETGLASTFTNVPAEAWGTILI